MTDKLDTDREPMPPDEVDLEQYDASLNVAFKELAERLAPVLRESSEPESETDRGHDNNLSPLRCKILEHTERLEVLAEKIKDVTRSLDIP